MKLKLHERIPLDDETHPGDNHNDNDIPDMLLEPEAKRLCTDKSKGTSVAKLMDETQQVSSIYDNNSDDFEQSPHHETGHSSKDPSLLPHNAPHNRRITFTEETKRALDQK